jgi:heme A synthase
VSRFTLLAIMAVISTLTLVVVGAVVRTTGSGLGCPEWPTCHGSWVPPMDDPHAIIEWSHRTVAAITGAFVGILAVAAVVSQRGRPSVVVTSVVAFGLLVFQAWLGKVTVESELSGDIVTAHLATAMALLALLIFVALRSAYPMTTMPGVIDRLTILAVAATAATYGLLLLGAHVRATGTALAFNDWPLMGGVLLPLGDSSVLPHVIHRWAAVAVGLLVGWFALTAAATNGPAARLARWAVALYLVQVVVGGLQVLTGLAPWTQVLHVGLGAVTFGALVAASLVVWYGPMPAAERAPA